MRHLPVLAAKPFSCSQCAACCRLVGKVIPGWPVDTQTGACVHLANNGSCKVYETRPSLCRVDSWGVGPAWYQANYDACNAMQVALGIDLSFRVPQ